MTHPKQSPAIGHDKKIVGRWFSIFFTLVFICLLTYYWPMFKMLILDKIH